MDISKEYVEGQLAIFKDKCDTGEWDSLKQGLDKEYFNPCEESQIDCPAIKCSECIFEFEDEGRINLGQTLKIIKDNPEIIQIVELLS